MARYRLFFALFASAAAAGLSACGHQISYPIQKSDGWYGAPVGGTLRVEMFEDATPRDQQIDVLVGDEYWRVNGREGYPAGEIASGLTKMLARHLAQSGLFQKVIGPGQGGAADFVLSGTISDFNASGQVREDSERKIALGTAAGVPGSALAGIATQNDRTQASSVVHFSNLRITESSSGRRVWSRANLVSRSYEGNAHFLKSDTGAIYRRADWELRRAVNEMIQDIGTSLR